MDKKENFNIIDFGSSKIRFTVFDKDLNNRYIDTAEIKLTDNFSSQLTNVQKLIKQAEKKNSSHIENTILLFDTPDVFTIDVSLNKTFSNKIDLKKIYSLTILELKQIINTKVLKINILLTDNLNQDGEEIKKYIVQVLLSPKATLIKLEKIKFHF